MTWECMGPGTDQIHATVPGLHSQPLACSQRALAVLATVTSGCNKQLPRRWDYVETWTGPVMLYRAVKAFERAKGRGLTVLDPGVIYPLDWHNTLYVGNATPEQNDAVICAPSSKYFSEVQCKQLFPEAYAITYWSHSWGI